MRIPLIGAAIILGLLGVFFLAKGDAKPSATASNKPSMSMQSIAMDVANGGQLLDVRTPAEYAAGHIDGSINFPLQTIQAGTMPPVAKDKPVYVYCHSGNRSRQASAALKAAGYQHITDLGAIGHVQSLGGVIKS